MPSHLSHPADPKKHIVVIDDELHVLNATSRLLRAAGFRVSATTSAKEAMERVVNERADAIVTDLYMADLGGHMVLAMLARAAPDAARVLMTSETDFARVAELMVPYSVDALVSKPEAGAKLVPILREVLAQKRHAASGRQDEARAHARSIVRALALRDCETEAHCERVAAWSRRLAGALGLPPVRMLDVELGALLHDVGKIGVRDQVLLKPGPLTPDEWKEMRRHPELGAALLAEIPVLAGAVPIVRCHHERLDGKGYPNGLAGDEVPIDARIFQVIDAYDAIVSDRPYRKGQSDAIARQEILRMTGSQFDPAVVETFMSIDVVEWLAVGQSAVAQATIAPPDTDEDLGYLRQPA